MPNTVFFSLPATGGSHFKELLSRHFKHRFISINWENILTRLPLIGEVDCVFGSLPLVVTKMENDTTRKHLMIFRNPIERAAIHLSTLLQKDPVARHIYRSCNMSFQHALLDTYVSFNIANAYTRLLGFVPDDRGISCCEKIDGRTLSKIISEYLSLRVTEQVFERAVENLNRTISVGLFDYMPYTQYAYEDILQIPNHKIFAPPTDPDFVVGYKSADLTMIEEFNNFDARLYTYAKSLFAEQVAKDLFSRKELLFTLGGPTPHRGLYEREMYKGIKFRWTNGHARLQVSTPENYKMVSVKVKIITADTEKIQVDKIKITDGDNWAIKTENNGELAIFEMMHRNVGGNWGGGFEISIISPVFSYSGDPRLLGVPVCSINVAKVT